MKVIARRIQLIDALAVVGSVIRPRTPKPCLLCLKLSCNKDVLVISGTNLEVCVRYTCAEVQVERSGECLIPADKLTQIIRTCADDTLTIDVDGDHARIISADSTFKVFTQAVADYPPIPDFEGLPHFNIEGKVLAKLVKQTRYAAAKESTRYAFNGALFVVSKDNLMVVCTDGRRLALSKGAISDVSDDLDLKLAPIIPANTLDMIESLIVDEKTVVGVQITPNQAVFHSDYATLTTNLIEGSFPPYEDVTPKDCDKFVTASSSDLMLAVKKAALLTTDDSKGIRLAFSSKRGVKMTSRNPETGEVEVNFPCKYEGSDLEIGFNPTFVGEAIRVCESDEVKMEMIAPNRPAIIRAGEYLCVIMPINLS